MGQYQVVQLENGRWIWTFLTGDMVDTRRSFGHSVVEFPSAEEANQDLVRLQSAQQVEGRYVVSEGYLQSLVNLIAVAEPSCGGASIDGVHWHEPENERGANWDVSHIGGADDAPACYDAIRPKIEELRRRFLIEDPQ
jgi:hypothetical protein